MSRVVALYSAFNAQGTLVESMWSVAPKVDAIRVVDGRFSRFVCPGPHVNHEPDHANSCDKTEAEVRQFMDENPELDIQYLKWPVMPENDKRTKMFGLLGEDDVGLVVDDDEIYYGADSAMRKFAMTAPAQVGWVLMFSPRASKDYTARLFRSSPGLHYDSYAVLRDDKGPVCDIHEGFVTHWKDCFKVPDVRVVHLYGEGRLGSIGYRATAEREQARVRYDELLAKNDWR
jgi:hypothetical protein